MHPEQLTPAIELYCGDCLAVLATLPENSLDACVCDPPYHLTSIVKRFSNAKPETEDYAMSKSKSAYMSRGFMGKAWDGGDIAFRPEVWAAVYRVLKPGAHLLAFGGTRTYHRMACAIEDAGFEVRDCVQWIYGSGFPKSLDISKAIDKAAGAEREVTGISGYAARRIQTKERPGIATVKGFANPETSAYVTAPATDAAREWSGWGTALKPACELIVLARKPLSEKTVAANVLRWGTGALNIAGARIGYCGDNDKAGATPGGKCTALSGALAGKAQKEDAEREARKRGWISEKEYNGEDDGVRHPDRGDWAEHWDGACRQEGITFGRSEFERPEQKGRWPANVIHDGSDEVVGAFPDAPGQQRSTGPEFKSERNVYGVYAETAAHEPRGDSGSAARFFYTSKADGEDRLGSKHPTVKPVDLIQHLVRLVTPPKGTVLDLFAGTGTTGEAAWREGMRAILIERESEYQDDIRRRMKLAMAGPAERKRETAREKHKDKPVNLGPLFGGN